MVIRLLFALFHFIYLFYLEEPPVAIQAPPPEESSDEAWRRAQAAAAAKVSRRKSRVQKQRSYDDESKTTQGQVQPADTGLGKEQVLSISSLKRVFNTLSLIQSSSG